jgi:hypothetical protein
MQRCTIQPTAVGRRGRRTKIKLKCSSLMRGERGYVGVPMHLIAQPCIALHHLLPKSRSDPKGLPMSYGCMPGVRCMLSARGTLYVVCQGCIKDTRIPKNSRCVFAAKAPENWPARSSSPLHAKAACVTAGSTGRTDRPIGGRSALAGARMSDRSGYWAGQGAGGRAWLCMHAISAKHGVEQIFRRYVALRTRRRSAVCTSLQQSTGTVP